MSNRELIVLGGFAFSAVVFGILTTRSSLKRDPVRGGLGAQVFHYIGVSAFVCLLPGVLTSLILGIAHFAVPIAISLLVVSLVSMFLYALFERPARAGLPVVQEDQGWTEEDARRSGL